MARYKSVAYIAHHHCQDTGNVREYFAQHSKNFYSYLLPPTYDNKPAVFRHYQNGTLIHTREVWHKQHVSKLFIVFLYSYDYIRFLHTYRIKNTTIIFTYPTLAFFHSWTTLLLSNTSILWAHDFFPHATGVVKIYNALMRYYMNTMPIALYLSPALQNIYQAKKGITGKFRKIISLGIKNTVHPRAPKKGLIGYIGALNTGKGIEVLLETARAHPEIHLHIIGVGPLFAWITTYVATHALEKQVTVFGFIPEQSLPSITHTWEAGAGLYEHTDRNAADITDPGKIKLYVGLGVPVLMTPTSFLYPEIQVSHAGVIVEYTASAVLQGLHTIRKDYAKYTHGIHTMQKKWDYEHCYKTGFAFLE